MSGWMERRALARAPWMRARALSALAAVVLTACGGGGDGGNAPPPKPPVTAISSLSADATSAVAGDQPITLRATATGTTAAVEWDVVGPGEIRVGTEAGSATYYPPGQEFLDEAATATITAHVTGAEKSIAITLTPKTLAGHTWALSQTTTRHWTQVAYGGGAFIALASESDAIFRSTDGHTWTSVPAASFGGLRAVAWGDAGWAGASADGRFVSSADGATWTVGTAFLENMGTQVVFGNGHYVMTTTWPANEERILVSANGIDWSVGAPRLSHVAFGGGRFVGIGASGVQTSVDGTSWTVVPGSRIDLDAIAYGNGRFVATSLNDVGTSVDGANWSFTWPGATSSGQDDLSFAGGLFLRGLSDGTATSADGLTWSLQASQDGGFVSVAAHDGAMVAVTHSGMLERSTDGAQWEEILNGSLGNLTAVAFDGGDASRDSAYVAVSDSGWSVRSTDTKLWTRGRIGATDGAFAARGLVHGGSVWMAVGTQPGDGVSGVAWFSVDGLSWVQAAVPAQAQPLVGVAYDGTRFVAIGSQGGVYSSAQDGTWSQVATLANVAPTAITFSDGRLVVVASNGLAAVSTDAAHWNVCAPLQTARPGVDPTPLALAGVTHDGSGFLAVGVDGEVARSTDGRTWVVGVLGIWGAPLAAVAAGDGVIVAPASANQIFTSADGAEWRQRVTSHPGYEVHAVTFGDGRFVAVGDDGEIIVSQR